MDWISDNLYWTEVDPTGNRPYGRIMVSKSDGRYRRSLLTLGLENPTAIAVDPQLGRLVWADVGTQPKIEISWMDGSKRNPLVMDRLGEPSSLAIDYSMDHTIYWTDSKLNTIESIEHDGSNRKIVLQGKNLQQPISLDVFENNLYWVTKFTGELVRQDKFGRGVPQILVKDILGPGGVKVYHPMRYNTTLRDPCRSDRCTHLCVAIPAGYRCLCPDSVGGHNPHVSERVCDAPDERARPAPRVCQCENSGYCEINPSGQLDCVCPVFAHGDHCELAYESNKFGGTTAAIVIPIVVSVLVLLAAAAILLVLKKRPL